MFTIPVQLEYQESFPSLLQNTYLGTEKEICQTQLDSQKTFSNTNFFI